jgi:hypothetical protein
MRRVAFAVLSSCVVAFIALFAGPSHAGDYYSDDGYYSRPYHRNVHVWYSSSCCYRRVVRHAAYYERLDHYGYDDRSYRSGYYDRPYRRYGYYDRPYRGGYYDRSYRDGYYGRSRYSDYSYDRGYGGSYASSCYWRRTRVLDGRGGWVWGSRRVCD